jgi:hydroxyethylthiazole kinase
MVWHDVHEIRQRAPLLHNITNYVVMHSTANALLAIGASPVMAHAIEEAAEMAGLAQALVLNIGTLSAPWVDAMLEAGKAARRRRIPIVLDPVGSGATSFRTATAQKLIQTCSPTIIRGNASEIRSLATSDMGTKGVDSRHTPEEVVDDARRLARSVGCVVCVSGAVDLIVDGDRVARVSNGHPIMTKVTGMGCTASALTGAFAAVNPSSFRAAAHAMAVMGIAGEMAAERVSGPGSFPGAFLDALHSVGEADLSQRLKIQWE